MKTQSILFVDDNKMVLTILERWLEEEKFHIHMANTPKEALRIIEQHPIDVVVSDLLMPGMDGLAFLTMMKADYPHVVRIILSGHLHTQSMLSAINQVGIFKFLTKPLELTETLKNILYEALQQSERNLFAYHAEQQFANHLSAFITDMMKITDQPYVLINHNHLVMANHHSMNQMYPVGQSLLHPVHDGIHLAAHDVYIARQELEHYTSDICTIHQLVFKDTILRVIYFH
ncbi:response regulator [Paenibacillus sp. PK4536]|uniref:Heme response regulator HssR n=1 Tax=Paenibacillus nuruki TaxID=1886670 RepID=A0A1E3KXV1_9BACL|nr:MULTISPECIES: response regulator [Paenibacillus]ODP26141.1 Heme response regulator HssR [Paenibacillus nuruki]WIM39137.1 response regulator [Paenibacillus sp. PK4536]